MDTEARETDNMSAKTEEISRSVNPLVLCYKEASDRFKASEITEDEYLESIMAHCTNLRHGQNRHCNGDTPAAETEGQVSPYAANLADQDDLFVRTMAKWIEAFVLDKGKDIKDITPILNTVKAYRKDDGPGFKIALAEVSGAYDDLDRDKLKDRLSRTLRNRLMGCAMRDSKKSVIDIVMREKACRRDFENNRAFQTTVMDMKEAGQRPELIELIEGLGFQAARPARIYMDVGHLPDADRYYM